MKRIWLSSKRTWLGKAAAKGLKSLGWQLDAAPDNADARVLVLRNGGEKCAIPEGKGPLILLAPAGDRLDLAAFSLAVQRLAISAAPATRVNAIAVAKAFENEAAATVDWLAGAEMVTGQLLILSGAPGPML